VYHFNANEAFFFERQLAQKLCGQSLFFEANVASVGVSDPKKKTFDDLEE
jgi:hypothetical protein